MVWLVCSCVAAYGQARTVTGVVTSSEDGSPLPGVNIVIEGTSRGTTTDVGGKFSVQAAPEDYLLISFIGFKQERVQVGNQSAIEIKLESDLLSLSEVVVVGYGAVKKSDLTGSVSSVKAKDIEAFPSLSAVGTLQGRAAGVQIQANNGGEPGANYNIRIRGGTSINASSDPIIVVDGFVGAEMPPPQDIASIEVLKDASATAIYGSRGANGVILVSTKQGKSGQMKIDFNTSYSSQKVLNQLDLLTGDQFTDYMQDINPGYTGGGANTDWQDEIYRTGFISNNQLSLSGGTDNVRYYLSGTYFDQDGVIIGSDYKRYSLNSNIDVKATDRLSIGLNMYGRRSTSAGVSTQEGSGGAGSAGIVSSAFRFNPDLPIYKEEGSFTRSIVGDQIDNPYALGTQYDRENKTDYFRFNTYGDLKILDWLNFKTTLGISVNNYRTGEFYPTTLMRGESQNGTADINSGKNTSVLTENYFTVDKEIGSAHHITWVTGYSFQKYTNENWQAGSKGFISNSVGFWSLGQGSTANIPSSGISERLIKSYYTRANYSLLDKYKFTFTARYDGASNFAAKNKWAFFPSGAFAWDMKQESFMDNFETVTSWKWRVSYGVTGNQAIGPYESLARLGSVYASRDGAQINALHPTNLANSDLTWESTKQFDIGLDVGLINGRVNATVDYYRMVTDDLLFDRKLPSYVGVGTQLQNIGSVENKGLELTISSKNIVGDFTWDTDFNISMNRNKVLELPDSIQYLNSSPGHFILNDATQILTEGQPVGVFFGYEYAGVYQAGDEVGSFESDPVGGEKFVDVNGDSKLNADDRTIIGDPNPKFIWSINNTFSYKNFDLNIFFQGSQGNDMLSYTLMELDVLSGQNNATTAALVRWTPENTNTDVPKAGTRNKRPSSRFVYDGSYVRLKNIMLGYTFPSAMLQKVSLRSLRLYVSAQNIWTLTDFPGLDPEVNYRGSSINKGIDYGSYPNVKSVTFGLNIGL